MKRRTSGPRHSCNIALLTLLWWLICWPCQSSWAHDDDIPPHACDPVGPFGLPGLQSPPDQIGEFGPVEATPFYAVHQVLLHTGKVLMWEHTIIKPAYL